MMRFFAALLAGSLAVLAVSAADDPPMPLKPTPLPFNTERDEDDPHISSDELHFFYTVAGKEKAEVFFSERKKPKEAWGTGKAFGELKTKTANTRGVFLTPDGKFPQYLYFGSDKDAEKKGQKGDNFDLYYLTRQTADQKEFTNESALITLGTEADEMYPWLSPDQRQIHFSRKDKDGWRLYAGNRPGLVGQFGAPMKLDFPADFYHATLTPDGKVMILQGPLEGKGDKKRWGLYLSSNTTGKAWSKPEPLTLLNNAAGTLGDVSPCLSRDGQTLYFASDRPGGKGGLDIYLIPTAQLVKKKEK